MVGKEFNDHEVDGLFAGVGSIPNHLELGRRVITGDALDTDFWNKLEMTDNIKLVLLAMPDHHGNHYAAEQLHRMERCSFQVAALAHFKTDEDELRALGVNPVYNMYEEAGAGFAHHVWTELNIPSSQAADKV